MNSLLRDGTQRLMRRSARFLYIHSLTLLATVIAIGVIFGVDQVSHIAFHLPSLSLASLFTFHGIFILCFWLFVILMLSCDVLLAVYVIPVEPGSCVDRIGNMFQAKWCGILVIFLVLVCVAAASLDVQSLDKNVLWGLALGIPTFWLLAKKDHAVAARVLDIPWTFLGGPSAPFPTMWGWAAFVLILVLTPLFFVLIYRGHEMWQAGIGFFSIAIFYCCWVLAGWRHASWYPKNPARTWVLLRPAGRGLWILLCTNILGEMIWGLAHWCPDFVSFRNYSIWSIFHVLFSLLLVARLLDWLAFQTRWPMRFLGVVFGSVVLYFVSVPAHVGAPGDENAIAAAKKDDADAKTVQWLEAFAERIEECPKGKPILVVAASGGGSRAALFSALVYESLSQLRFESAGKNRSWADQIALISSVSGGSLATAYFGSQKFPISEQRPRRNWQHSITKEIQEWLPMKAKQFREKIETQVNDAADERVKKTLKADIELWKQIETISSDLAKLSDAELDSDKNTNVWMLKDACADDMCTDFMAPLMRGVMYPGEERGVSVSDFWKRFSGFRHSNLDKWPKARPLLLMNATQVEDGKRLVVGFPPVPGGFMTRGQAVQFLANLNIDANLRKNYPFCLGDYDPSYKISLAEAVRLSANFPWGFNPGLLKIMHPLTKYPYLKVVDGGVFDNTGFDTLASIFLAVFACANDDDEAIKKQAVRIVNALKKRGVLILEIDSGANPGKPGAVARMLNQIFDPVEGLEKAGYVNAQNSKLNYFRQFQEALRDQVKVLAPAEKNSGKPKKDTTEIDTIVPLCNFFQYHCNHSEDVMTAWAIGPDDKAAVFVQFLFEQQTKQESLANTLAEITRGIEIVEEFRRQKSDSTKFASAFREFQKKSEEFGKEQAILTFAAINSKNALQGTVKQAEKRFGYMLQAKPPVDSVPGVEDRGPLMQLDVSSIERVMKRRMDQSLSTEKEKK